MDQKPIEVSWAEACPKIKAINPEIFNHTSEFFLDKEKDQFKIFLFDPENETYRIHAVYPKADVTTDYYFDVNTVNCEFYFENKGKGLYLEILNGFDDFHSYFEIDKNSGSTIARLLWEKHIEEFEDRRDAGEEAELEEDFQNFLDNFVNYILNDVYLD